MMGMGSQGGGVGDDRMDTIQSLVENHYKIHRVYNHTANGIISTTTSDDETIAKVSSERKYSSDSMNIIAVSVSESLQS